MRGIFILYFLFAITSIHGVRRNKPSVKMDDESPFEAVTKSPYFVDKTAMLLALSRRGSFVFTCPNSFGKSTNADMIKRFFDIVINENTGIRADKKKIPSYRLFTDKSLNLAVAGNLTFVEKHLGEHSVMHLSFSNVQGTTLEQIIASMAEKLGNFFASYRWLYKIMEVRCKTSRNDIFGSDLKKFADVVSGTADQIQMVQGLGACVKFLEKHHHRSVIVIIEDYDAPTMQAIRAGIDAKLIDDLMHSIIEQFVKDERNIRNVILFGVSRLFKKNDAIKSVEYFLTDACSFGQYFGFTQSEVDGILGKKQISETQRTAIKDYYNGYHFKKHHHNSEVKEAMLIYNPKNLLRYLENNILENDNKAESLISNIMHCLQHEDFFNSLSSLLANKRTFCPPDYYMPKSDLKLFVDMVQTNCSSCVKFTPFLTFLHDNGYLSYTSDEAYIVIPNKIVENKLLREFQRYFMETYGTNVANSSLIAAIGSIVNSQITTDEMLTTLADSLNHLLKPIHETLLDEFPIQSVVYAAILGGLNERKDVKLRDFDNTAEAYIYGYQTLRYMSDDRKIILIIRITFSKTLKDAIEQVHRYVPVIPRSTSPFELVKYLAVNFDDNNRAEVGKAESRSDW